MTVLAADNPANTSVGPMFRATELKRVGIAATMIAVCGTIIVLTVMLAIGHYNPLAHCGPKAVLDGAAIALLIGRRGRWRCLALLGAVYGFVLLLQIGLFYLLPVMIIAGAIGALVGWMTSPIHRTLAILLAACAYELISSFGSPIKIYFGTGGSNEPFIWALWLAEWPLRIVGIAIGVVLAKRWAATRIVFGGPSTGAPIDRPEISLARSQRDARVRTRGFASRKSPFPVTVATRVLACMLACSVPMALKSWQALAIAAGIYLLYALLAGMRKSLLHATLALLWGWLLFGALSYLWHRDLHRVLDLGRTWTLRFAPIFFASIVLVAKVKPRELVRLLRRLHIPAAIILPLSTVIRALPASRRSVRQSIEQLRTDGRWTGPGSLFRNPRHILTAVLAPPLSRWAHELAREAD